MLIVEDLSIRFVRYRGLLDRQEITALDGVDLDARPGEFVALVGQSGSGKSLFAHAVLGILPRNARVGGRILYAGALLDPSRQRALRGRRMVLVPQALTWLDPTATTGRQVGWSARAAGLPAGRAAVIAEFARYGLAADAADLYPHQLSGGMARRVLTAIATISRADLLIADEPTNGLDADACRLALTLLRRLADEGRTVVVITHDLPAVLPFADRVAVLHSGRTVEIVDAGAFRNGGPMHPYSRALRAALPEYGFVAGMEATSEFPTDGCRHAGECELASRLCGVRPDWVRHAGGRARCHHVRSV
jgi:peptide/nickel transport system ATP-binding protein